VKFDAQTYDLAPQRSLSVVSGFSASAFYCSSGMNKLLVGLSLADTGFVPPRP